MRLTVLGHFGPFPRPGGACSGYLVESGDTRLLLDCGSGVVSNLLRVCPAGLLHGVVLSHLHMDHASDMGVLRYAREGSGCLPLPVIAPDEPAGAAGLLLDHPAFCWERSEAGRTYRIGAFTIRLFPAQHPVPTFAMLVSDGRRSLFYTGDTGFFPALADAARGADALLADACFSEPDLAVKPPIHMTAAQTARLARQAGAGRLLLTHISGASGEISGFTEPGIDFSPAMVVQDMGIIDI